MKVEFLVRIVVLFCLVLIIYANVWLRVQVLMLGYRISGVECENEGLVREHRLLWLELCRLKRLERVENLSAAELQLIAPEKLEIIKVVKKLERD